MYYLQDDWKEHFHDRSLCEQFYIGQQAKAHIMKSCSYDISELARLGLEDLFDRDLFEYNTTTQLGRCMLVLPENREQTPSYGFRGIQTRIKGHARQDARTAACREQKS